LKKVGIKKSAKEHENLVDYLCIHKNIPDNLVVDKIRKAIKDSEKLRKQKSIGLKVNYHLSHSLLYRNAQGYSVAWMTMNLKMPEKYRKRTSQIPKVFLLKLKKTHRKKLMSLMSKMNIMKTTTTMGVEPTSHQLQG
jgi:hypothetical protein